MKSIYRSSGFARLLLGLGIVSSTFSLPDTATARQHGLLIPLYIHPGEKPEDNPAYRLVAETAEAHPDLEIIAIVNPANGPDERRDPAYGKALSYLAGHGVRLAGYVAESYGGRPVRALRREIRSWRRLYPEVTLIFLDETAAHETATEWKAYALRRYTSLSRFSRRLGLQGIIANTGRRVGSWYLTSGLFYMIVVYENSRPPSIGELQELDAMETESETLTAMLVYGEKTWNRELFRRLMDVAGFLLVNDHSLDVTGRGNYPWSYLPENLPTQAEMMSDEN